MITRWTAAGAVHLRMTDRVTASDCPDLRELFAESSTPRDAEGRPLPVVVDMGGVTAVEDAVFALLLTASAQARIAGSDVTIGAASMSVRRSLAALELTSRFPISESDATDAIEPVSVAEPEIREALARLSALIPSQRAAADRPHTIALI